MGFPRTQNGELDFDAYFTLTSEQRLAVLEKVLSPALTKDEQEDLDMIRTRIIQKQHEIVSQREKDPSISQPIFMEELFVALNASVKEMQAQKAQKPQNLKKVVPLELETEADFDVAAEERSFFLAKEPKKENRRKCIIC